MTSEEERDILCKLSPERDGRDKGVTLPDVWKVNSEKSGNKYEKSTITTIAQGNKPCQFQEKSFSELYKNVSIQNWANQFSEIYFESLILAQDERWRRA